jgi:glycine dehydrogenase subunit 2
MYRKLIFELSKTGRRGHNLPVCDVPEQPVNRLVQEKYLRKKEAELPQVAENEIVRHYTTLSALNHHVDKALYPLGSCTMKYNPKINEKLAALPSFANLHPEQPVGEVQGALQIMYELQEFLKTLTGLDGVSLQPAAGAHGELVGLLMMQQYHKKKRQQRQTVLIPDSAHGTNPASAAIAGFKIETIRSNEHGLVDIADLRAKVNSNVAGLMLTNPNTLGLFERQIREIRTILDQVDAVFYMDGANMNALFGVVRPGDMGFDVMHLNLHKSFSTPHGSGGPGSGPVAASRKLLKYLPYPLVKFDGRKYTLSKADDQSIGRIHSFYGNFALLLRAYIYIRLTGAEGFPKISEHAIINANYLYHRLKNHFELGYPTRPMHEFVLSALWISPNAFLISDFIRRLFIFR